MTAPVPQTPSSKYPVDLTFAYPEKSSRLLALLGILMPIKVLLLIPHIFVLYFLELASAIVAFIGYFVVLFTGKYPKGMYDFVAGVLRWQIRLSAWIFGLADGYPPFSLN